MLVALGGDVGGVGPDRSHPFVIRNFRAWASHWAYHGGAPSVMIDGLKSHDNNYGIWRPNMRFNEYKNLSFTKTRRADLFNPFGGNPTLPDDYDKFVKFTDDLPPQTVVTRVQRTASGELKVYGTTSDNGEVAKVLVNGKEAKPTGKNFAEWEAVLAGADAQASTVTAAATDKRGNAEQTPHAVAIQAGVAHAAH